VNDPREILLNELVSSGIPKTLAYSVSLDAGSSQAIIDKEYLEELKISKEMEEIILEKVSRFYFGYYDNDNSH